MDFEYKIKTLYEMFYPYSAYKYNRANACLMIKKELKKLCNNEYRHILLIVAKYLDMSYTRDTPNIKICEFIQDKLHEICLETNPYRSDDMEASKYIIGLKTGIVDYSSEDINNCNYFLKIFQNFGIYTVLSLLEESGYYESEFDTYVNDHRRYNVVITSKRKVQQKNILKYKIKYDKIPYKYKKLLDNGNFSFYFNKMKESAPEFFTEDFWKNKIYNPSDPGAREYTFYENESLFKTDSQAKTIVKIMNMGLEGKISLFDNFKTICRKLT